MRAPALIEPVLKQESLIAIPLAIPKAGVIRSESGEEEQQLESLCNEQLFSIVPSEHFHVLNLTSLCTNFSS
jgi:hypothetical protein